MAIDKNADFTPSIPDSDVVPTKLPYNKRGGFKFWAQKVIPLVYNDSLSYYEVLCKVVNYLNNVIQNVDNLNESVNSTNQSFETLKGYVNTTKDTLINTYNELQNYVNTYFDNLDVQYEINAKLDDMADSGELTNLLAPFIPDLVTQWLNNHVTPTSPVVDNTLSISGAAADAKVTGNKITELKEDLNDISEVGFNLYNPNKTTSGYYTNTGNGNLIADERFGVTDYIAVPSGSTIKAIASVNGVWSQTNSVRFNCVYDADKQFVSGDASMNTCFSYTNSTNATQYIRFTTFEHHSSYVVSNLMIYYYNGTIPLVTDYEAFHYVVKTNVISADEVAEEIMSGNNEIKTAVDSLLGTIIPSYWSNEVENTITSVNDYIWTNANGATNSTIIAFVTDMHIEKAAKVHGALIGGLDKVLHFDFVVNGGDNNTSAETNYSHELAMQESMNLLNPVRNKLFTLMGNHDATNVSAGYVYTAAQKNILITEIMKKECNFEGADLDNSSLWLTYYRDDSFTKIRYIFLDNCYAYPDRFKQADINWLNTVLSSTPSGYHVAIFMHNPGRFENISATTLLNNWKLNAQTLFYKMLSAFDNKTSINYTEDSVTIDADYTSTGKPIIGVFAGHVHADLLFTVEGINVCTTKNAFTDTGEDGTTNETAFDCIVINKTEKEVKLFRCGKGSDRSFSY